MKKILSLILVLLLAAMAFTALADDSITAGDIETSIPETSKIEINPKDDSAFGDAGDVVTVDGNTYTVVAGNLTYTLNVDPSLGLIVLTQDYFTSMGSAWQLGIDMDAFVQACTSDGTHIWAYSQYTGAMISIRSWGMADRASAIVGDLSTASEDYQSAYLQAFATANDLKANGLIVAGSTTWMQFEDTILITVAGGEYVIVNWTSDEPMAEDDLADLTDYLAGLTITG